ncbi:MAG: 50S ribosomal protein L7Ae [Candidatus Micrarchaeia archaeon]
MAKSYVKFQTPGDVQSKTLEAVEAAKNAKGLRKGTNEATKAIERGTAKLVVIAEDVDPEEIVAHMPEICAEHKTAYVYVSEKVELGKAAGLGVGTAAVAITNAGSADAAMKDVVKKAAALSGQTGKDEAKTEKKV